MGEWAGLGITPAPRNLLKCAREPLVRARRPIPPPITPPMLQLPGIGPYTAAPVSSIAFDLARSRCWDGNVETGDGPAYDIHTPLPAAKPDS